MRPLDIPRANRIYVNRNLRLDKIEMVGFDMDYTLALYNQPRIEELSMRATLHKLVTAKGYPEAILGLAYDPTLAVRGLVIDRENGNIFKPDRYGFPGRARHGLASIDREHAVDLYQGERTRLSNRRYAWIDSLFALPEAVLYGCLVDYFDRHQLAGKPSYSTIWENIRECIDLAHRDGSIKTVVGDELAGFVELDAGGEPLRKASAGPFQRGRIYMGGNIKDFQERARASGDRVLFVGDHIYGDMLRSRKSSNWRTAMVLQELEHEVTTHDRIRPELSRLDRLDAELIHLDGGLNEREGGLRTLPKH